MNALNSSSRFLTSWNRIAISEYIDDGNITTIKNHQKQTKCLSIITFLGLFLLIGIGLNTLFYGAPATVAIPIGSLILSFSFPAFIIFLINLIKAFKYHQQMNRYGAVLSIERIYNIYFDSYPRDNNYDLACESFIQELSDVEFINLYKHIQLQSNPSKFSPLLQSRLNYEILKQQI